MWGLGTLPEGTYHINNTTAELMSHYNKNDHLTGFPAAAYAAYAAGRGYSSYPSFGLPYPTGKIFISTPSIPN